jgi:hypothetical protein
MLLYRSSADTVSEHNRIDTVSAEWSSVHGQNIHSVGGEEWIQHLRIAGYYRAKRTVRYHGDQRFGYRRAIYNRTKQLLGGSISVFRADFR